MEKNFVLASCAHLFGLNQGAVGLLDCAMAYLSRQADSFDGEQADRCLRMVFGGKYHVKENGFTLVRSDTISVEFQYTRNPAGVNWTVNLHTEEVTSVSWTESL